MELNSFIKDFAAQFTETDECEFRANTRFRDLEEWSSLTALSIIAMINYEYEATIRGTDIRNAETIEDLFKIVLARK
jgi:acyl carrier protein